MTRRLASGILIGLSAVVVLGLANAREEWPYGVFFAVFALWTGVATVMIILEVDRLKRRRRQR